jgi:hypothetical protein
MRYLTSVFTILNPVNDMHNHPVTKTTWCEVHDDNEFSAIFASWPMHKVFCMSLFQTIT